jgi:23S rRNA pseudouridine955/2504/2580 synthase
MINFKEIIEFEDDDFIVINKPYNISTLEDRDKTKQNILKLAKEYSSDAQVCHRLDKETSGILAVAKNPEAYRHLSMQFENREVVKIYHAVVGGNRRLENEMVEKSILQMKDGIVRIDREGKAAATIFNTLEVFGKYSLMACFPITGRMHQIRIHLASIGLPIVADSQYGGKDIFLSTLKKKFNLKKDTEELPLMKRVALHAYALTFKDMKQKEVTVQASYPKDFSVLLKQLSTNT